MAILAFQSLKRYNAESTSSFGRFEFRSAQIWHDRRQCVAAHPALLWRAMRSQR